MKNAIALLLLLFWVPLAAQVPPAATVESKTIIESTAPWIDIRTHGAVGDGTSNPVSEWLTGGPRSKGYANLAAIQAVIPDVTSLTDEIDWAATQRALNVARDRNGSTIFIPTGDWVFNKHITIKGSGTTIKGQSRKSTWIAFTDNAATGIKWATGLAGIEPYFTRFEDFTLRAKTTGTNTGIGVDTRNAGVEGFWMFNVSAERVDVLGFDTCWLASNLPLFLMEDCIFVGVTYGVDLAKCDTFKIESCGGGGAGPDKAPGTQLNCLNNTVFRVRNNTTGTPVSPNFGGEISGGGEYGNGLHFVDMLSGNLTIMNVNTETYSGDWTIRQTSGNLRVEGVRFANSLAVSTDAIYLQNGSGGTHVTFTNNKLETIAAPVVYQGDDNYYSSWDIDVPVQWKNTAGTLQYSTTAGKFQAKNQTFWTNIYAPASYVGTPLRRPRNATTPEDVIFSYLDGNGVARGSSMLNDNLSRVIDIMTAGVVSAAGAETYPVQDTVPAGTQVAAGNEIVFEAFGTFAADTSNKQIKLYDSGAVFDSGTLTHNGKAWRLTMSGMWRSQFEIITTTTLFVDGVAPITKTNYQALDLTVSRMISLGTTTANASGISIFGAKTIFKR